MAVYLSKMVATTVGSMIKIDTPIKRHAVLFHQKQVEYFPVIRNSHTIMQIIACFTITTSKRSSKAGTKINCRRNGKEVIFESR